MRSARSPSSRAASATAVARRGQRTVFKSVGSALEDLAAAMLVHGADAQRRA